LKVPIIGGSYTSQSLNAAADRSMNLYPEIIEQEEDNRIVLYPAPGTRLFCDMGGAGGVRGEFTIGTPNGKRTFALAGVNFNEIFSNGGFKTWGTVVNDSFMGSFASSAQQLLFESAGTAYVFDLGLNTLTTIAGATFSGNVSQVGYSDGFFIVLIANSNTFYISGILNATDWITNGASLVSVFPDNLVGMLIDHRELWFWSSTKAVVYGDSGNAQFPFDVVPAGFIEQGLAAKNSPVKLDNTIFWLGADDRGAGVVWRAQGYTPARVSNHAIEFAMQGYSRIDDAIGYSFQMQGHYFYQLYFPTANATWRYDTATNMWHEVGYWDQGIGQFTAHRSQCHTFNFGKHLVGDWKTNKIYEMAIPSYSNGVWLFADDDGNPIRRLRRAAHLDKEQKLTTHHQLQVYLETGLGPEPPLAGTEAPTNLTLVDSNGVVWFISVDDTGVFNSNPGWGTNQTLLINDPSNSTSWQIGAATNGVFTTTQLPLDPTYPKALSMVSASGTLRYTIQVTAVGQLESNLGEPVSRPPMINLRWSNDGAHTWSNEYSVSAGNSGEYTKRCMWRRLGRARDRVYEISMSDPIPWRIVSGFLQVGA
jgi:hypothetical protein